MKAPGLIALLGKASPSEDEEEPVEGAAAGGGVEKEFAREAFAALKDDDESGFVESFIAAVRACARKSESDDTGEDDYEPEYPE